MLIFAFAIRFTQATVLCSMIELKKHRVVSLRHPSFTTISEMFDLDFDSLILSESIMKCLCKNNVVISSHDELFFKHLIKNHPEMIDSFNLITRRFDYDYGDKSHIILYSFCTLIFVRYMFDERLDPKDGDVFEQIIHRHYPSYTDKMKLIKLRHEYFRNRSFSMSVVSWFLRKLIYTSLPHCFFDCGFELFSPTVSKYLSERFGITFIARGDTEYSSENFIKNLRSRVMPNAKQLLKETLFQMCVSSIMKGTNPNDAIERFVDVHNDLMCMADMAHIPFHYFLPNSITANITSHMLF